MKKLSEKSKIFFLGAIIGVVLVPIGIFSLSSQLAEKIPSSIYWIIYFPGVSIMLLVESILGTLIGGLLFGCIAMAAWYGFLFVVINNAINWCKKMLVH